MKEYPAIFSEDVTLDAMLDGASIARFGDGEWRCAIDGGSCTSQRADRNMARELRAVLKAQTTGFIVGLPNPFHGCPREESWRKYTVSPFVDLLNCDHYWSSFITRPDNAPWIDTPEYWARVRKLWADQHVILVVGTEKNGNGPEKKSITSEMMGEGDRARSIVTVVGPRQHAYAEINRIEGDILSATKDEPRARVLMCLGVTATVLAWRLAMNGIHAFDLGHIGMFMRHAGAYRYDARDVVSDKYRLQLEAMHAKQKWGADGAKHADAVRQIIAETNPATILDYGCGEHKLAAALHPLRVSGYDPGLPERAKMPKPCDLVVCTDVLEHVEPEKLAAVLDHIFRLTASTAYFVISTRLANAILPDGRNAHLSIHDADWWIETLRAVGWRIDHISVNKDLAVIAKKS